MNIGDKVRLLHGKEEGVITRIGSGGQVEIEIEDGFRIPALKSEVVVINEAEKQYFERGDTEKAKDLVDLSRKKNQSDTDGIFLSYVPYNDRQHGMILVNDTNKDLLFSVSEVHGDNSKNLEAGIVLAHSYKKIDEKSIQDFEQWPVLHIIIITLNHKVERTIKPFERKVKFKASSFFKSRGKAPLLEKEGYLFRLDEKIKDLDVGLLNKDLNPSSSAGTPLQTTKRPLPEVDLHIEKLTKDHDLMSNKEKLTLQMEVFEKNLNAAIISGMDEITFIHGIGNGVLRKEIHRNLSQLNGIKYFQDSHKTNFGYGATLVKIQE